MTLVRYLKGGFCAVSCLDQLESETMNSRITLGLAIAGLFAAGTVRPAAADLPLPGDVVLAVSQDVPNQAPTSFDLARGPANGTGMSVPNPWTVDPFIGSVRFDNFDGIAHNASGNLIGVNFGPPGGGGSIYSFSTTDESVHAGQLIGDTAGLGGGGINLDRLTGVSVSPDNAKIAVMGYNNGRVIVYDYTPGDTMGGGASLSGARETAGLTLSTTDTQGTAWLDDNTVLAVKTMTGTIYEINATTMAATSVGALAFPAPFSTGSNTYVLYEPEISPYVFVNWNNFDGATTNKLYVLDPNNNYSLEHTVDLSISSNTMREMAFDSDGNLFWATFGSAVEVILGAAADPTNIADNSSADWFTSTLFASFPGIDVGRGTTGPECDFNGDDLCNVDDINALGVQVIAGSNDPDFDLNDDGLVNNADRDDWLALAGAENGFSEPYQLGDSNLDGVVDGLDFVDWNVNKFDAPGATTPWSDADWDFNNFVDGRDFTLWNGNKFDPITASAVPEPCGLLLALLSLLGLAQCRRR
jgi:hypothetical protein